jgi:hypothetical protein
MRLRNGKRLGEADEAEGSNMDTSSTQAELGSPHHTNRLVDQMAMGDSQVQRH